MTSSYGLVSCGQGPQECALALAGIKPIFLERAQDAGFMVDWNDAGEGARSAQFCVHGENAISWTSKFFGTWAWKCKSPLRPHHKRSLWFLECFSIEPPAGKTTIDMRDVSFKTMRAGGPGGQHQNTTESAVMAFWTCPQTKISYQASSRDERSQHQNRATALSRLQSQIALAQELKNANRDSKIHALRAKRPSGEPVLNLHGLDFSIIRWP